MRLRRVYLVFKKDWREVSRNPQIMLPLILVPIAFSTFFPFIIGSVQRLTLSQVETRGLEALIRNMPEQNRAELLQMTAEQVIFYALSVYFYAPLFLMIPIMVSSVIASDSFAGEKERKTIEPLLATPLCDSELFLGKILVSLLPALLATLASFIVYSSTVNFVSTRVLNGRILLPNSVWAILVLCLAPAIAGAC
ncbi:MAG: ABC transporter permease subunit, partial [Candidatus Bathyarchaeia archaeon]